MINQTTLQGFEFSTVKISHFGSPRWRTTYVREIFMLHYVGVEKKGKLDDEEWSILDRKCVGVIRRCLTEEVYNNVDEVSTTKDLMDTLERLYQKSSASGKIMLCEQLFNLRMNEGETVSIHLGRFKSIISQLSKVDITFSDEVKALRLLSSLPTSWDTAVTSISNSAGNERTFWGAVAEEYAAAEPPTGFQGIISWLFLPAVVAGLAYHVPGEYLYIGAGIFVVIFCIIEMDKPDKPHNFEPQIYNMERGARDKLIADYNTMDIWDFNEKYGELWDFTVNNENIVKR